MARSSRLKPPPQKTWGSDLQPDFWHQRWRDNQIGFHQEQVTPLLEQSWPQIGAAAWSVELLERRDILAGQPKFVEEGVTALSTCAYRLEKRS